jgi:hypothetical protein
MDRDTEEFSDALGALLLGEAPGDTLEQRIHAAWGAMLDELPGSVIR